MSIFTYSYESSIINILEIQTTPTSSTDQILQLYGVYGINKWRGVGILICWSIVYRVLFYVVLITKFDGRRKE